MTTINGFRAEVPYSKITSLIVLHGEVWLMIASSASLVPLEVYPRASLARMFGISDSSLNNGVFMPRGHSSVWLFATREKGRDRTQYFDLLDGRILTFEGQSSGRTDAKIMNHEAEGNELLAFYRERKDQYPEYGFLYLGRFRYVAHEGEKPRRFSLAALDLANGV